MERIDVLVVGAGPVGLLMAAELARHGVAARVIDKAPAPADKSKALAVHARTLEVFDDIGVIDEALARGRKLHAFAGYAGGTRVVHIAMDELDSPYPYVLCLPQYDTERILAELCRRLGVQVERSRELCGLEQDVAGVTATLDGGETVHARWLIGCDGAHSRVRAAIDLPYEGADLGMPFCFADLPCEWDMPDDEGHNFLSPEGFALCIPLPEPGRWRIVANLPPGSSEPELDKAFFEEVLARRSGKPARLGDPVWTAFFQVRQRKVPNYRRGRVLLAGDAAHCHSPIGGQGMNTGLQDAYNLAWKLALVVRGVGQSGLLDSYSAEREPIATSLLRGTERGTRVVTLRHPVQQALRNELMRLVSGLEVVQQRLARGVGQLGVGYRQSPIVAERRGSLLGARVGGDGESETPTVRDWRSFGAAPLPGDRAPDAPIGEDGATLHGLTRTTRHVLLLFDGDAATDAGYATLGGIARQVTERYGDYIDVHVVVPGTERPAALEWDGSVLLDATRDLHERYGAGAECLYLIRPDGYVGFRSQPADADALFGHLGRIFL